MDTMKKIVENQQPLLAFLYDNFSNETKKSMKKYLTKGSVFVNDKKVTKYDFLLKKGMVVEIKKETIHHKIRDTRLVILYEDHDLIIVDKPSGMLTIATEKEQESTMYHILSNYVKEYSKNAKIFIVHRLDRDTSGILIFAKNEKTKQQLQNNWDNLVKVREYLCLVEGILELKEETITMYLKENENHCVYPVKNDTQGKKTITHYQVIKAKKGNTLLTIHIDTGRKHQIRVAMKSIGHPIVGDKRYGAQSNPFRRLALHAYKLVFIHPITQKEMIIKTDIPRFCK